MTLEIGQGFGTTYRREPITIPTRDSREIEIITGVVGNVKVVVIARENIVPEDPYVLLCRAAAYRISTGKPFPAPRTPRNIKDHLIRVT
jgi:hypothetical protein